MGFRTCVIGPVTLICGDMQEVLVDWVGQFDAVVTDAPYRLTSGGRGSSGDGSMAGIFDPDVYDNSGDLMAIMNWNQMGPPIYRACKPDADAYFMANDKNLFLAQGAFQGAGFRLHNLLVWDKHAPTVNRWYMKHLEYTLYMWKGAARVIAEPGSKQLFKSPRPSSRVHATQKPVSLMAHYINNSTRPGDLVLDPFMGSGTTLIAAILTGRRAVGIEIDPDMFDVACARVKAALMPEGAA